MNTVATSDRYQHALATLSAVHQQHVLEHWSALGDDQRHQLLDQIDSVDWPELARLVQTHVLHTPEFHLPENVQPAPWYAHQPSAALQPKYNQARQLGWDLIKAGKLAAFTVAGGQGTRLGWNGPKGTYPATPIRKLSLFGCFAEYISHMQRRCRVNIPWYIMTSPINDADTRAYFKDHRYFGLDPAAVFIFPQAMMPAVDMKTGKVLLEAPDSIALSPNGHGGSLKALYTSGAIADMKKRGIEHISYIQVDNPLVRVLDPIFIGLHEMDGAQMSSKMLPKREPLEKLGNFCLVEGKVMVIEYSDLPDPLAHERLPDGQLRFLAGSIAIHLLQVDFVAALNEKAGGFALPFHRAEKKVPFYDEKTRQLIKPEKNNAVKLETFVFDALPMCDASIIYETDRADEFAPIKNADGPGALDCPLTSKLIQINRAARWLEAQGVKIARDVDGKVMPTIELTQATAIYPEDLAGKTLPKMIDATEQILL